MAVDMGAVRNCGICCGGFSFFAMIFLLCVGGLIGSGSTLIDVPSSDSRSSAASACYYAALIYFFMILLSVGCFFGPYFYKKKNSDLDALRKSNARQQ